MLDDPAALKLKRKRPARVLAGAPRPQPRASPPVIRTELFQNGRVVDHRTLDYRNPVFGVASLSYSRAVTAIAATWLAVWRDVARRPHAHGQPGDRAARPRSRGAARAGRDADARPSPEARNP